MTTGIIYCVEMMNVGNYSGVIELDKIVTLVATNQALFRIGICHIFSRSPGFIVYSNTLDYSLLASVEIYSPQVLLLDIDGSLNRGLEYAGKISTMFPGVRMIIMTYNPDENLLSSIIKTGAVAYLDKSISEEGLIKAVKEVSEGVFPLDDSILMKPEIGADVLRKFQHEHSINNCPDSSADTPLTSRETEILGYIAEGNSNKQIAFSLRISEQTTKNHVSNILRKLRANDRAHAVVVALRRGWITVGEAPVSLMAVTNK
jgi:DNA-binding NarL/FixJ family response regulator